MDNIEYRLTDTALLSFGNEFWGINYFFPGDTDLLPSLTPLLMFMEMENPMLSLSTWSGWLSLSILKMKSLLQNMLPFHWS